MSDFRPIKYFVTDRVSIENADPELRFPDRPHWAIRRDTGSCLNRSGEFVYEPRPSERDDEFYANHRFTLEEAFACAELWLRLKHRPKKS